MHKKINKHIKYIKNKYKSFNKMKYTQGIKAFV